MSDQYILGLPGMTAERTSQHRIVGLQGLPVILAQGKLIDGALARDTGNTGDIDVLRAGLLMGKVTASSKYANCVIGQLQSAAAAGATAVTLTAAQALELVRRVGATGTIRFVGPPTAGGVVATFTETYSAVNTTTGVVTVSALDAALVAESFVAADDGSYIPLTFIGDTFGKKVTDADGASLASVEFSQVPVSEIVDSSKLIPWPSDVSLRAWIVTQLKAAGVFAFNHVY